MKEACIATQPYINSTQLHGDDSEESVTVVTRVELVTSKIEKMKGAVAFYKRFARVKPLATFNILASTLQVIFLSFTLINMITGIIA